MDDLSLAGAVEAAAAHLIVPVLVGPQGRIRKAAESAGLDISDFEIVDTPHSHAAAARACELARDGQVSAIMKGALHTDELLEAAVSAACGLRTERRMSHVFILDVPTYPKPLLVSDAAINIAPDLATKADIVQNAIDCARAMKVERPKVAIRAAVETVNPKMAATLDAAALCKMADRGQITAISHYSHDPGEAKHIASEVAGDADILIVPDIESGNMLAKQLFYLARAQSAGVVMGAKVPIMLTSRSDGVLSRLASCAVALLVAQAERSKPAR